MNPITFECPHCHAIIAGDASAYGQRIKCENCQAEILVPPAPAATLQTARLVGEPAAAGFPVLAKPAQETEVFRLSPVARAFPGQILLGLLFLALAVGLAIQAPAYTWPRWVALVPLVTGALVLGLLWIRVKSCSYRLTTQRLFVRRGWLARHVNELELYRVKDVVLDQGGLQRLLGYGTITVVANDDTTPEVRLVGIPSPASVKEMIRNRYRDARQQEGVQPTEFMQSPST